MILKQSHVLSAAHICLTNAGYILRLENCLYGPVSSPDATDDADVHFVYVFFTATERLQSEQLLPTKQKSRKKMLNFIWLKSNDIQNCHVIKMYNCTASYEIWQVYRKRQSYFSQPENEHNGPVIFASYAHIFLAHFVTDSGHKQGWITNWVTQATAPKPQWASKAPGWLCQWFW